jgi:hypothetical protein
MNAVFERWGSVLGAIVLSGWVAACDSGPGESEFVAACLNEGRAGANKALSNALGVDREKFCQCGAKAARAGMTADGRQLMVWEMQGGKRKEIAALQAKMSDDEKMAVMKAGFEVFGKCAGGG